MIRHRAPLRALAAGGTDRHVLPERAAFARWHIELGLRADRIERPASVSSCVSSRTLPARSVTSARPSGRSAILMAFIAPVLYLRLISVHAALDPPGGARAPPVAQWIEQRFS
jgi:hypothetical protein